MGSRGPRADLASADWRPRALLAELRVNTLTRTLRRIVNDHVGVDGGIGVCSLCGGEGRTVLSVAHQAMYRPDGPPCPASLAFGVLYELWQAMHGIEVPVGEEGVPLRTRGVTDDPTDPRLGRGVDDEPTAQHEVYLVLSDAERAKGFVRPLRTSYVHVGTGGTETARTGEGCGVETTMGTALAETYARDPNFYGATYCVGCSKHLAVDEFIWSDGSGSAVGS